MGPQPTTRESVARAGRAAGWLGRGHPRPLQEVFMRHSVLAAAAVVACAWAAPAFADASPASIDVAPSSREVQTAVDAYLASGKADASLVGGPGGAAGYDNGFWIGS